MNDISHSRFSRYGTQGLKRLSRLSRKDGDARIDAVRFRKHLCGAEPMGKIDLVWNSKARKLTIRDNGTGMTQETIEKFLLNVGSSFYQSEAVLQQHGSFSAISRFGIDVLSTFMIADEVQILRVHPDDEFARRLTLPSVVKSYLNKNMPEGHPDVQAIGPHGTEVVLQVRRSADLTDVEALVRFWLVIPKCEVTCKTDDLPPVKIGFAGAREVLQHYYESAVAKERWRPTSELREELTPGIEFAYVVKKSVFADVWEFARMPDRVRHGRDDGSESEADLTSLQACASRVFGFVPRLRATSLGTERLGRLPTCLGEGRQRQT